MENVPTHIFDWIEQMPFEALSQSCQKEVLQYYSAEEYNQLHQAAIIASSYAQQGKNSLTPAPDALESLHAVFDARYPEKKNKLNVLIYWKAAASLLLLAVTIATFGWYKAQHQGPKVITLTKTDTVFVNNATDSFSSNPLRIYDTVYLETPRQNYKTQHSHTPQSSTLSNPQVNGSALPNVQSITTVPFSEKDQPLNRQKNNSIKDDTLVQNFGFVQL